MKRNIPAFTLGHPLQGYAKELEASLNLGALVENPEQYDGQTITFGGLIENKSDRRRSAMRLCPFFALKIILVRLM